VLRIASLDLWRPSAHGQIPVSQPLRYSAVLSEAEQIKVSSDLTPGVAAAADA